MEAVLKAVAEPRRREIMLLIRSQERTAGDIASRFDVSRPAISQHLGILREAGLVTERREGTRRFYKARAEGLQELQNFLDDFWGSRLEKLRIRAERRTDEARKNAQ